MRVRSTRSARRSPGASRVSGDWDWGTSPAQTPPWSIHRAGRAAPYAVAVQCRRACRVSRPLRPGTRLPGSLQAAGSGSVCASAPSSAYWRTGVLISVKSPGHTRGDRCTALRSCHHHRGEAIHAAVPCRPQPRPRDLARSGDTTWHALLLPCSVCSGTVAGGLGQSEGRCSAAAVTHTRPTSLSTVLRSMPQPSPCPPLDSPSTSTAGDYGQPKRGSGTNPDPDLLPAAHSLPALARTRTSNISSHQRASGHKLTPGPQPPRHLLHR